MSSVPFTQRPPVAKLKRPGASSPRTKRRSCCEDILIFTESWWPCEASMASLLADFWQGWNHLFLMGKWSCSIANCWHKQRIYPRNSRKLTVSFTAIHTAHLADSLVQKKTAQAPGRQLIHSCANFLMLPLLLIKSLGAGCSSWWSKSVLGSWAKPKHWPSSDSPSLKANGLSQLRAILSLTWSASVLAALRQPIRRETRAFLAHVWTPWGWKRRIECHQMLSISWLESSQKKKSGQNMSVHMSVHQFSRIHASLAELQLPWAHRALRVLGAHGAQGTPAAIFRGHLQSLRNVSQRCVDRNKTWPVYGWNS